MDDWKELQRNFKTMFAFATGIEFIGENLQISFQYANVKSLFSKCKIIFSKDSYYIDEQLYAQENGFPATGSILKLCTTVQKLMRYKIFASENEEELCNLIITGFSESTKTLSEFLFLTGKELMDYKNLGGKVQDTIKCLAVFQHLRLFADYTFPGTMIFICTTLLDMPSKFSAEYVTPLKLADKFLDINIDEDKPEVKMFISILGDRLANEAKTDRLKLFFLRFDSIIQGYLESVNNFYVKYDIHCLKLELDNTWINLNDKIRGSLENIKGEILLIISAVIAVTQFDFTWSNSIVKNIMILSGLLICSTLYSYLVICDWKNLGGFEEILTEEQNRLMQIKVSVEQQSDKLALIDKDMSQLKTSVKWHKRFLKLCVLVIWVPIAVLIIFMS